MSKPSGSTLSAIHRSRVTRKKVSGRKWYCTYRDNPYCRFVTSVLHNAGEAAQAADLQMYLAPS